MIIAIDGPGAAGKGTLARRLAQALDLAYLDTGLLYRAVAAKVLDAGGDPAAPAPAEAAARAITLQDLDRRGEQGRRVHQRLADILYLARRHLAQQALSPRQVAPSQKV